MQDWRAKLGRNVRRLRHQRGLTQEQLAFEAEIDLTYVGGIERGRRNGCAVRKFEGGTRPHNSQWGGQGFDSPRLRHRNYRGNRDFLRFLDKAAGRVFQNSSSNSSSRPMRLLSVWIAAPS